VEREGGVAWIRLARPAQHNAFDPAMLAELRQALSTLAADGAVRVLALAGDGRSFCAGADLAHTRAMAAAGHDANVQDALALADTLELLRSCPKPVLARVHGAALGGGAGLVACADIAVAALDTRFAFSEVRMGLVPAVIAPFVLDKVAVAAARELFLTGERFDAARAREIGLVQHVVPPEELDAAVAERLQALLAGAPGAQAAAKGLIARVQARSETLRDDTARLNAERRASAEGQEGMAAFLEKRPPDWATEPAP
jgi:methylglutaconyl-CoA hydratase